MSRCNAMFSGKAYFHMVKSNNNYMYIAVKLT